MIKISKLVMMPSTKKRSAILEQNSVIARMVVTYVKNDTLNFSYISEYDDNVNHKTKLISKNAE